ncbi:GNAT family N-acetyltransferase [Allonocardiopsis opalescens]|uniref:L-amino acid N-acyltransferase YncA n=1 Tax=Allonocardiopsis opalescens TaxID=1144618 RepID=A0A2T0Q7E4_9ACTN|nr:GNAT family N-acetyltransferase [Allonocardiopsis opalescens]PRX99643.1 L-amino acid N-acyltransferase YncA [Allonocardiopsis opalescens]
MRIRTATADDWPAVWPFFRSIVAAADTFCYDPATGYDEGRGLWMLDAPARTAVAVSDDGSTVLGSAKMNPNQGGPGAHVSSASFMVDPAHAGRGVGRALCRDALDWARAEGYTAMQFNAVSAANTRAVGLYRSLGFSVVGTVPEGFRHPALGLVGLHIMHRRL